MQTKTLDTTNEAAGGASAVERVVRPRTRDELMASRWMLKELSAYDNTGTVRTGREWFNRYMLFPWERGGFELVA